jgi:electron transfer flavoprotein alpha subunit
MNICIIVEHNHQQVHPSFRHILTAAQMFGQPEITACVIGYQCASVADDVAVIKGVSRVVCVDDACYKDQLAENLSLLIREISTDYDFILMASTTFGKDLLPRVAGLLNVGLLSDVTKILSHDTFERPIYAGNAIETVRILDEKKLLTLRQTAFQPVTETQTPVAIVRLSRSISCSKTVLVRRALTQSQRPELTNAKRIVSGGRGLQNADNFKLIEMLADALGAALGASRAAVDAGFIANDAQVGQTGKIVAPELYVAVGISGAIQHVAGMKDSKVIVAINKDPDAPIFQIADYGLVGDLFILIPELIEKLKNRS